MAPGFYKLMLVTHRQGQPLADYLRFIENCVCSGVTSVQLREKEETTAFLLDYARQLKRLLDRYHIPLIINDNLDLALEVGAHGVHLGQTDGCPIRTRERLGTDKFLGLSLETEEDLIHANTCKLDYVAASAVFATANKANIRTVWGIKGLERLTAGSLHPVIAIGGIDQYNIRDVMNAGARGIAVIGALHDAPVPNSMAAHLRHLIESASDKGEKNE